jgi:hypothetical protein
MEQEIQKLQDEVLSIRSDLVYILYLVERIDKNVQLHLSTITAAADEDVYTQPFPSEGMHVEKF